MSIKIHTYTAQSGKEFRSLKMEEVFKLLGMPEQAQYGCGLSRDGKTLLLWEPRAVKEAKVNGVMGKPLAKLGTPSKEGAPQSALEEKLASLEKALAMLLTQTSHAPSAERAAPIGTTITRRKKVA